MNFFTQIARKVRGTPPDWHAPFSAMPEGLTRVSAATGTSGLLDPPPPKPATKPAALPSWKTQQARAQGSLPADDRRMAVSDAEQLRYAGTTNQVVRQMAAVNPDLSATINAYLRTGIPNNYMIFARDLNGEFNVEATRIAYEVLARLTMLGDPSLGYNPTTDLRSLSESLGKELVMYGAMSAELVLNPAKQGMYINPVSVTKLEWREEDGGAYPVQNVAGKIINLDIATFYYLSADQDLLNAYATSRVEAAIQAVIADNAFLNQLRKAMARVLQPRIVATITEKIIRDTAPPEVLADATKMIAYQNAVFEGVVAQLDGLQPEDALISYDSVKYETLATSGSAGSSVSDVMKAVQKILRDKVLAGANINAAALGQDSTSSAAATSTMLFVKNADLIRQKLNTLYSRILTTALRLLGQDVMVEFIYDDLDLRPASELEAFKAMRQSRVLEWLSLGMISDEECAIWLTGRLPRGKMVSLSGTMFKAGGLQVENPQSNTSTMNKGGAPDNLKPSTPSNPKS